MIIAAVCLGKFVPSGHPINVPFGKGHDHGEAYKTLLQFYDILESRADGFAATVGDVIVFLNREDAMKHAIENDQVNYAHHKGSELVMLPMLPWQAYSTIGRLTGALPSRFSEYRLAAS